MTGFCGGSKRSPGFIWSRREIEVERGEAMKIVCPKCDEVLGEATSVARLILTVHCPFDGHDFGVAVVPPEQVPLPAPVAETPAPAST
ncbi:MAG TPA: hypothetical protein VE077_17725 [Candidatus Methylomirabilis sp.]|nr:hypothetical protein [Candidatus Methylomirabilis sp.]